MSSELSTLSYLGSDERVRREAFAGIEREAGWVVATNDLIRWARGNVTTASERTVCTCTMLLRHKS